MQAGEDIIELDVAEEGRLDDHHHLRSDEIGLGPYGGSYVDLTVQSGEIIEASRHLALVQFAPQVWEPFAAWVSATYPGGAGVMYTDGSLAEAPLSEESIALGEARTREYAAIESGRLVTMAEQLMEARIAYDTRTGCCPVKVRTRVRQA